MSLLIVMLLCIVKMGLITAYALVRGHNTHGLETTLKHKLKEYMPEQLIKNQSEQPTAHSIVMDLGATLEQPDNWNKIESMQVIHKRAINFRVHALKQPTDLPQRQERPAFKIVK
ncbi:hypothetical protein [Pseudoalteromonas sp. H105]|uniref:hypothetical protein n=1 Tax=Pseudoalteromonas sp. H105 TaxID=1348393 RepID=UPI00073224C5|nr:hypothetical protein [Pseudoalteromonas sp. H105]KTF14808.1 hypothetical protein ATS75_11910 [Pseudoalteromonas sp. H105]